MSEGGAETLRLVVPQAASPFKGQELFRAVVVANVVLFIGHLELRRRRRCPSPRQRSTALSCRAAVA